MLLYAFLPDFFVFVFPLPSLMSDPWIICGLVIIAIGLVVETASMFTLGENFRIAFPREETTLVTHGIYRTVRNPIVLSVFLFVIGTFLVCPNLLTLVNLIGNLITFNAKATDEERFLAERFGSEWNAYVRHSGKYLPIFYRK
ncbi:MAG TPA: isoprenylcysteine carboxylmethyltransferase family protein [Candidatus Lokiarchaeia archaeon]|nr:isoprenylcysteine carboxylmethyltransferase family protein [Candidatus Lokiarchaeia archaeon]